MTEKSQNDALVDMSHPTEVFLGLGANLDRPLDQLASALRSLKPVLKPLEVSGWYRSKPIGPKGQPDYYNIACRGWTTLSPEALLTKCQAIESAHHRIRGERWGPRTLDIDILYFGTAHIHTEELRVPHPERLNRVFVVYPLLDLIPSAVSPTGDRLDRSRYDSSDISRLAAEDIPAWDA
jgi:2-amino-4-hydroxy-6-hydroxymethyldihydropteridine diphosphokinase